MGCNNSSLNGDGEVLPVRLRPLLRQRMEEFRKRRSNGVSLGVGEEGGLSKKQLLKDDAAEDENSQSSDENEIEKKQNVLVRVVVVEKLSKVVPLPDFECMNDELQCRDHKDQEQEKVKDVAKEVDIKKSVPEPEDKFEEVSEKHEEVNYAKDDEEYAQHKEAYAKCEEESAKQKEANAKHELETAKHHSDDEENDEEEEDDDDYEIGRCIGPGSPSFRIYYVEAEKRKQEEKICEKPTIAVHHKSPSAESNDSESVASGSSRNTGNSNEVVKIESAPKRKGNRIKKFGGMKKNLFHVKHLHMNGMNKMMACTGNDRKSILSQH